MSYTTKVIYAGDSHFTNPTTITESGQPESVGLQGLTPNSNYFTKAEIWVNGIHQDTSDTETFSTLQAGVITLTHNQTNRSGYGYDVEYIYTSTYAPSWATLSTNGTTFQGFINSAQNSVSFYVTGLTPGDAYLTSVTMGDIYGETATVQGSIVTTVVNDIDITSVDTAFTSADVNVEYIVDGGFYVGYVEWWLGTQDPAQDQPQGHEYFNNGAETVTISNLSSGTEYKFKASITLNDQVTTVSSSVVAAETEIPYAQRYFTIENVANGSNTIGLLASNENTEITVDVSTDNGQTWSHVTSNTSGATLATLGVGEKLIMKHVDGLGYDDTNGNKITATDSFTAYGNIASLTHDTGFNTTGLTMPDYAFVDLFNGVGDKLTNASNLVFSSYSTAGVHGCTRMFYGCTAIETTPNLSSITTLKNNCYLRMFHNCTGLQTVTSLPATSIPNSSYNQMFRGCTSLRTAPTLSATTISGTSYSYMFAGCTALTSMPALPATTLGNYCYQYMFSGCTALTSASELPATSIQQYSYRYMFSGCTSLRTAPRLSHVTSIGTGGLNGMFSGCSLINEMYAPIVTTWNTGNSTDWLEHVAATGTMYKTSSLSMPTDSSSGIPTGWTAETKNELEYFTIENISDSNVDVFLKNVNGLSSGRNYKTVAVSTDNGRTWTNYTSNENGTRVVNLRANEKLLMRATGAWTTYHSGTSSLYEYNYINLFSNGGYVKVYGNIASLTHGSNFANTGLTPPPYAFPYLFYQQYCVVDASDLYFGSYSEAPFMLKMFEDCSRLQKAPKIQVSRIPANALANAFTRCTSLTESADLRTVRSLDISSLDTTFAACSSLSVVYAPSVDSWNWNYTTYWLSEVAATGVLYKPSGLTIPISPSGVPSGWSTEDY